MANKSSNNEVANLGLEILKRIPKQRKVTAKEIQEQLQSSGIERSLRTIQRNLDMLSQSFDIEKDETNKPYGYRWISNNASLALASLSPQEAVLLNLAHDYLSNLLSPSIMKSLGGVFSEAKYQLYPDPSNTKERAWLKKVRVVSEGVSLLAPSIDASVFENISEALYHDRLLSIDYYNSAQQQKAAQVMPLGLAQQGKRLYLVCRFDGYDNERNIAVHRVLNARVSSFTFKRPIDFKLSEYDANGRFGFSDDKKCLLQFCINKDAGFHLTETPLAIGQKIVEKENHYQVSAVVADSLWLARWIKGFGKDIWNVTQAPIKQAPIKQEPIKQEPIKQEPIKHEK